MTVDQQVEYMGKIEREIAIPLERRIDALKEELQKAKAELDQRSKSADRMTRDAESRIDRATAVIQRHAGGDWKQLVLVLGSAVTGLAIGYYLQKNMDSRIPLFAFIGGGVALTGVLMPDLHWSVRSSLGVLGAMAAGGSVLYVVEVAYLKQPAPATPPEGVMA